MTTDKIEETFEKEEQKDTTMPTRAELFEIAKAILGGEMSTEAMSAEELANLSDIAGLIDADIDANQAEWLGEFGEAGTSTLEEHLAGFGPPSDDADDTFDENDLPASRTGTYQDSDDDEYHDIEHKSGNGEAAKVDAANASKAAKQAVKDSAEQADANQKGGIVYESTEAKSNASDDKSKQDDAQMPANPDEGYVPDVIVFNPPSLDPLILEDQEHFEIELLWEGNPDDEIALYEQDRFEPVIDTADIDDAIEHTTLPPVENMVGL